MSDTLQTTLVIIEHPLNFETSPFFRQLQTLIPYQMSSFCLPHPAPLIVTLLVNKKEVNQMVIEVLPDLQKSFNGLQIYFSLKSGLQSM